MKQKKSFLPDDALTKAVADRVKAPDCSYEEKLDLLEMLDERERRAKLNKLFYFKPYPYQKRFYEQGANSRFRFLCAATR